MTMKEINHEIMKMLIVTTCYFFQLSTVKPFYSHNIRTNLIQLL